MDKDKAGMAGMQKRGRNNLIDEVTALFVRPDITGKGG
jgi:hypothetical protein